ncbi:T-complex protein 11-domain-containing protein [Catenaria anguillulae PL171]|uniref:T-complex protein 11-domain-containing protein n=1 Tax=Catenaria anguillulae PL171 TaxID=765915 RepID=A0A1Y2HAX8_9FUNG|nr:T-complex protein 11-domain-containing protein [Catenaria anguillulae PL171]
MPVPIHARAHSSGLGGISFEIDAAHLRRQAKRPRHVAQRFHHHQAHAHDAHTHEAHVHPAWTHPHHAHVRVRHASADDSSSDDENHSGNTCLDSAARNRQRLLDARRAKLARHHGHVRLVMVDVATQRQSARRSTLLAVERTLEMARANRQATIESRRLQSAAAVERAKQVAQRTQEKNARRALQAQRVLQDKLRASQWRRVQIQKLSRACLNDGAVLEQGIRARAAVEIQTWWRRCTLGKPLADFVKLIRASTSAAPKSKPNPAGNKSAVPASLAGCLDVSRLAGMPFPQAAAVMQKPIVIRVTSRFLQKVKKCAPKAEVPALGKTPTRAFLTVFMLLAHSEAIIDNQEGALEKELINAGTALQAALTSLVSSFTSLARHSSDSSFHTSIAAFLQSWFTYHSTFEAFKSKDTQAIVNNLVVHALELARLLDNVSGANHDATDAEWRPSIVKQLKVMRQRLVRVGGEAAVDQLTSVLEAEGLVYVLQQAVEEGNRRPGSPDSDSVLVASPNRVVRGNTSPGNLRSPSPSATAALRTPSPAPAHMSPAPVSPTTASASNAHLASILDNHALAHEVVMDPEFILKPTPLPAQAQAVKDMAERAFADRLDGMISAGDFAFVPDLVAEIREALVGIAQQAGGNASDSQLVKNIEAALDPHLVKQELAARQGRVDVAALLGVIVTYMHQLAAPVRDADIRELQVLATSESNGFGKVVLKIHQLLDQMRLDLANFHLAQLRPVLQARAVEYESAKFAELVAASTTTTMDPLAKTRAWLEAASRDLLALRDQRNPEGIPLSDLTRPKFEDVYHEALLSLVSPTSAVAVSPETVPETLSMDARRLYVMQTMAQAVAIAGAVAMVVRNAFPWMRSATVTVERTMEGVVGRAVAPKVQASELAVTQMSGRLVDMLTSEDGSVPSVAHIAALVESAVAASVPGGAPLSQAQRDLIHTMVTKTINAKDPVLAIVSRRVHAALRTYLGMSSAALAAAVEPSSSAAAPAAAGGVRLRRDSLAANGLDVVDAQMNALGARLAAVARHNKAVYAQWYDEILGKALAL